MKKKLLLASVVLLLSACAGMQTPRETNVTVGALLEQIQIAVNEIAAGTRGNSMPPLRSAEITLSTTASTTSEGKASLLVSGGGSRTTSNSNTLTLELVPGTEKVSAMSMDVGRKIAASVIAAVKAVDRNGSLKLKTLTVEAGLNVNKSAEGGLEVTLVGISFNGKRSVASSTGNSLKLVFAYPGKDGK